MCRKRRNGASTLLTLAACASLAGSCGDGPPAIADSARNPVADRGQEELVVIARWPDGLAARDIQLDIYGLNAAGGAEPIDHGRTDHDGKLTFQILGGSGLAEIRACLIPIPWRASVTLPRESPIEVVLPPPHEVVVNVTSSEPAALNEIEFTARSNFATEWEEIRNEGQLQQTAPGRFVWRSLHARPVRLDFREYWGRFAVRPCSGTELTGEKEIEVSPPSEVRFEAIRKRRLLGRVLMNRSRPVSSASLQWRFSPSNNFNAKGETKADVNGGFEILEPDSWTMSVPPASASVRLESHDLRLAQSLMFDRPWPGSGDLDLGDILVAVKPGWDVNPATPPVTELTVVDDSGSPVAAARVLDGGREVARTDAAGRVNIPESSQTAYLVVSKGQHVPEGLDLFNGGPEWTVTLSRTATVEVEVRSRAEPGPEVILRRAESEDSYLSVEREGAGRRWSNPSNVAAVRGEKDLWIFEDLRPGMSFVLGYRHGFIDRAHPQPPLAPGETRRVNLPDPPHPPLEARVFDEHERPVPFALVTLFPGGTEDDEYRCRTRADGSFRFSGVRISGDSLLHVGARGLAFGGRSGKGIASPEPIRLETLRPVRVRAVDRNGRPIPAFRAYADRPEYWEYQPKLFMCGTGLEDMNRFPEIAIEGVVTVSILRGNRGGVTVEAEGISTHQRISPDEEVVVVTLEPMVSVRIRVTGLAGPMPGLFVRISESTNRADVGNALNAYAIEEAPWADFQHFELVPGLYTFELGMRDTSGAETIRSLNAVDVPRPAEDAKYGALDVSWAW